MKYLDKKQIIPHLPPVGGRGLHFPLKHLVLAMVRDRTLEYRGITPVFVPRAESMAGTVAEVGLAMPASVLAILAPHLSRHLELVPLLPTAC